MHTPNHLARPVTGHHPDETRPDIFLPSSLDVSHLFHPDPVPLMDRRSEIFIGLIRLRRQAVRLQWWQFLARRRIIDQITALQREQTAIQELDNLVRIVRKREVKP